MRQLAKNKRPSVYYGGGAKNEETAGGGVRASTMLAAGGIVAGTARIGDGRVERSKGSRGEMLMARLRMKKAQKAIAAEEAKGKEEVEASNSTEVEKFGADAGVCVEEVMELDLGAKMPEWRSLGRSDGKRRAGRQAK